jgi:hypothetical protein
VHATHTTAMCGRCIVHMPRMKNTLFFPPLHAHHAAHATHEEHVKYTEVCMHDMSRVDEHVDDVND